jgi:hypothetical protein
MFFAIGPTRAPSAHGERNHCFTTERARGWRPFQRTGSTISGGMRLVFAGVSDLRLYFSALYLSRGIRYPGELTELPSPFRLSAYRPVRSEFAPRATRQLA